MQRPETKGTGPVTLPNLFLQSVQRYQSKIAITTIDGEISFEDLDRNAEKWANHLVGFDHTKCLIILPPGLEYYTALIACMKANCLAIPVDETLPLEKMPELVTQAETCTCLCSESVASSISIRIPQHKTNILTPPDLNQEIDHERVHERGGGDDDFLLHCLTTSIFGDKHT